MKVLIAALFTLAVVSADPTKTIVQNAQATPALSTLVSVLTHPGYESVLALLNGPGPFTVFAPDNAAFDTARVDVSKVDLVKNVLAYHVLPGKVLSKDLASIQFPATLMSNQSYVNLGKDKAQVVEVTKNKEGVFVNPVSSGRFIPRVVTADVECSNGVVHIVSHVIFFPDAPLEVADRDRLTDFHFAVQKANLTATVQTTPSVTFFVPDNRAFEAVPKWRDLTSAQLAKILSHHAVSGVAYSNGLKDGMTVKSLDGQVHTVHINGTRVHIDDAAVIVPNVLTKNGVIHVIDRVLIPK